MRIKPKGVLGKNAFSTGVDVLLSYILFGLLFIGIIAYSFYFFKDELICAQRTGTCRYVSSTITKKLTDETIFSLKNIDQVAIIGHKISTGKRKYTRKPTISIRYGKSYTNNDITISYYTYFKFKNYYKNPTTDFYSANYNPWGIIIILGWIGIMIISKNIKNDEEKNTKEKKEKKQRKLKSKMLKKTTIFQQRRYSND